MRLGIIIYSNDSETVWNAFRLASLSAGMEDTVNVFLLGKGVESESPDTKEFNVTEQMNLFIESGGNLHACGLCLKLRKLEATDSFPISSLSDLYRIVLESDKVITF